MVGHLFSSFADVEVDVSDDATRPHSPTIGQLYDYVYGASGVFVRGTRDGLEACVPVADCELRGLADVEPYVGLSVPRVPSAIVAEIFARSREAFAGDAVLAPVEKLFYLHYDAGALAWTLDVPDQVATATSVRPTDATGGAACARALVEVHSHHAMDAFFSRADDADETGFRVYAVVGTIFSEPTIRVRVGVFGYCWEIPAREIFELPEDVQCAVEREEGAGYE